MSREQTAVGAYLPRLVLERRPDDPAHRAVEGSLLFSDVSGFTRLSERLARRGRAGAEVMVDTISSVFTPLIADLRAYDGDVLKFGGDALLVLFTGDDHTSRAAAAAHRLRATLRRVGSVHVGDATVRMRMSQGLHTGTFHLVVAGTDRFRDVLVVGPDATTTFELESAADAGEILLSEAAVAGLDHRLVGRRPDGRPQLIRAPRVPQSPHPTPAVPRPEHESYVPHSLRGRLAEVVAESEHRTCTVSFAVFHGCDRLLAEHGPRELVARLERLVRVAGDLAVRHRVTVVCVDGGPDGGKLMLTAGAPDSDEQDAVSMLRFVVDLRAADVGLDLQVGVNRGHVYAGLVGAPERFTYSTMGDAVNLAARLAGKAAPGQLLATEEVLAHTLGGFAAHALAPFTVKGKAQPVAAFAVDGPLDDSAGRSGAAEAAFVGRADELGLLLEALAASRVGRGGVVDVVAEAGTGKSRLLGELARQAGDEGTLRVRCDRQDLSEPYAVAGAVVRAALGIPPGAEALEAGRLLTAWVQGRAPTLVPWTPLVAVVVGARVPPTEETDRLSDDFRVSRLQWAVGSLLMAAATDPVLLIVEDVGSIDEASRGVLAASLAQVGQLPWLVVTSRRSVDPPLLADGSATRLELRPLHGKDAMDLALAAAAHRRVPRAELAELVHRSGGNPLFLLELVAAWTPGEGAQGLPESLEAVLAGRVDRLPPALRRLVRYASVLGDEVDPGLLAAGLEGVPPGSVLHEVWAAVLDPPSWSRVDDLLPRGADGTRRFRHELLRRVAYDSLPFARRRELHERVGLALERRGGADPGLLAHHFAEGADHPRCFSYAVRAGDAARSRYASAEAAEQYERAVAAGLEWGRLPAHLLAEVAELAGDAAELAGRYRSADTSYRTARRLAAATEQPRLLRKQGVLRERQGRYSEALRYWTRGLHAAEQLPEPTASAARAALLVGAAGARLRQGRFHDSVRLGREAVAAAERSGDRASLARAYSLLDSALTDRGEAEQAATFRELALPIYEQIGDLKGQADVLNNLGVDAYWEGRLDDAVACYRRSRDASEAAGDVVGAATAANNLAEVLSDQGRLDEAEEMFDRALAVWTRASFPIGVALATSNLGRLRARQGRPAEALALLEEALTGFRALHAEALAVDTEVRLAEVLLAAGRRAEALALCDDLLGPRAGAPGVVPHVDTLRALRQQVLEAEAPGRVSGQRA